MDLLNIKLLNNNTIMPSYASTGSAGIDIYSPITIIIPAGDVVIINSGFAIHIDDVNIGGFIYPRSGLSTKYGIVLANTIGVIDSDYQGEIKIPIKNQSDVDYTITRGDRFCQLVFQQVQHHKLSKVEQFKSPTIRGEGGFGHSGK